MTNKEKKDRQRKAATLAALGFGIPAAFNVASPRKGKLKPLLVNGALGYGAYKAVNNDVQSNAGNTALQIGGGLVGGIGALATIMNALGTEGLAAGLKNGDVKKAIKSTKDKQLIENLTPGKVRLVGHLGGTIPAAALSALGFATYAEAKKRKERNRRR
jgi:hypothetical protein